MSIDNSITGNRVNDESWYEAGIYVPYGTGVPYEDGISNRQRRALRAPSARERRQIAYNAQRQSGMRIRIARPVMNQLDFSDELKVWIPHVQHRLASRRSLGNLAMTVFDSNQQPLRFAEEYTVEYTEENLCDMFDRRYPALFQPSPPVEVTGTATFGNKQKPFIGLTLAKGFAHSDRSAVRGVVAPELLLGDDHLLEHSPHVSLGKVGNPELAAEIQAALEPVLPAYVKFGAAVISVESAT